MTIQLPKDVWCKNCGENIVEHGEYCMRCQSLVNRVEAAEAHVKRLLEEFAHDEACWRQVGMKAREVGWVERFCDQRARHIARGLQPDDGWLVVPDPYS